MATLNSPLPVRIDYFSDLLCVWAYAAQIRLDELEQHYATAIDIHQHFIPVFGCTQDSIAGSWKEKGGFPGYSAYVKQIAQRFPHVVVHPEIWTRNIPPTSASAHLFLKSVQLLQRKSLIDAAPQARLQGRNVFEAVTWALRVAFFRDLENVAERAVQLAIAERHAIPIAALVRQLEDGQAMALLCKDLQLHDKYKVSGSPTYVLNEGRQILYGNVGYNVIAANVEELVHQPGDQASWC
jgi:predicted DsbA family dithiol-disulfide isomerase